MADSEIIAGLGTRSSYVRAAPQALQRALGPEEAALVGAIGAGARLSEVLARCGLPESKAIALLLGLRLKGLVTAVNAPPAGAGAAAPPPVALDADALAERVDLDDARKREVLALEARLATDHYFSLLGVPVRASPADCKKAYYELTKRFHPDRYFGKNLGSYKDRIERIFRKLTEAQAVLSDPGKREAYIAQHPELAAPRQAAPSPLEEKRAAERRARLARHPYLAKQSKIFDLVSHGRECLEKGDFAKAVADLNLASQMEPKNREISDLLARAKKGADRLRAEAEYKDALALESAGDRLGAISRLRTAVNLDPDNPEIAHRMARLLLQVGGEAELKEAHRLARRATELKHSNLDYRLTYARILVRCGLEKNAARELEVVQKLDPSNAQAKEMLKKLRWKI